MTSIILYRFKIISRWENKSKEEDDCCIRWRLRRRTFAGCVVRFVLCHLLEVDEESCSVQLWSWNVLWLFQEPFTQGQTKVFILSFFLKALKVWPELLGNLASNFLLELFSLQKCWASMPTMQRDCTRKSSKIF